MSRGKILALLIALAFVLVLVAVFRSCRSGSEPPSETGPLDETSYRASAVHAAPVSIASALQLPPYPRRFGV